MLLSVRLLRVLAAAGVAVSVLPCSSQARAWQQTTQPPEPVVVEVDAGFRWGDAAIGAVITAGVSLVIFGITHTRSPITNRRPTDRGGTQ